MYCLFFLYYCLLFIVYCLLSIVYCLLSIVYCLLSIVYCLLSIVYCLSLPLVRLPSIITQIIAQLLLNFLFFFLQFLSFRHYSCWGIGTRSTPHPSRSQNQFVLSLQIYFFSLLFSFLLFITLMFDRWGQLNFFPTPGFRWPAQKRDSCANDSISCYAGNNTALTMGSLLALPPAININYMVRTKRKKKRK